MRITFILPGRGKNPVGGFKVVYEYANGLTQRGHDVSVVHPALLYIDTPLIDYPKRLAKYLQVKVDHSYLPTSWFSIDPRVRMLWRWSLDQKHIPDADVVIATSWQTAEWVANYPKSKGRKSYLLQHWENWGGVSEERLRQTWKLPLQKFVISRWLQDIAVDLGETAEYVPNGLDFTRFGLDISIEQRNPASVFMLYHEQIWKGSADGLCALEMVRSCRPDLRLDLFGTPKKPADLPSWIEYHRLPSQTELRALYNQNGIFLSPSWGEGWPLPPAEAMQCGAAVVATDIGGHREYLEDGVNGILRPRKNPSVLADAVLQLINDPELRITYAKRGHQSIQQFTWTCACDRLERFLMSLVKP
ncbi:glycosyltransferase family 4 protein [Acidithiobacillus sp. VAN18-1]|uniref:Glycosyltransferase family 4 protein n=1 Tax=Igneacidithiobacillus copahuensis TaxID=2724909 RepID=A0AAE2YNF9_9PROT|nr:glycosyltransferase family 4 protein [Igneacidithiobacillus copahuensis]MBU2786953.1 glycosyltransferase family 4 protein [Igneacidithiobacillus copahuensis]MBU2796538.1 glycosyltransferase family 4 protein [Acidithiobacillus sp. VAN18-2]